jgi:multidrug efflux pump
LLAVTLFHVEFTVMSLIGASLLIGILTKNAIMMIDFAIDASRAAPVRARTCDGRSAFRL